jgi:hypothetical protein
MADDRRPVRHIPKAQKLSQKIGDTEGDCDTLPPALAAAVRQLVRAEVKRLRRDEMFYLRRGMKAELDELNRELGIDQA